MRRKVWLSVAAIALVLCCAIGGTLAWLTAKTAPVTNTFTVGDIEIDLTETTSDYKMVPGNQIAKDPKVTVKANSEACWLFVMVEKSDNFGSFMTFEIADDWTELSAGSGIYYQKVQAKTIDQDFVVLKDSQVKVLDTVTKNMLTASDFTKPTLTFTAYAVQKDNVDSASDAWAKVNS